MADSAFILSVLVPLVFIIGLVLVVFFKRRIRNVPQIVRVLVLIVKISSFSLAVAYLSLSGINLAEFFRKAFVLYFTSLMMVFGFVLAAYQTFLTLFLLSFVISILHTEFETNKREFIIILCFLFILLHSLSYVIEIKINEEALRTEYIFIVPFFILWPVYIFYDMGILIALIGAKGVSFLVTFLSFIVFFPSLGCLNIFFIKKNYKEDNVLVPLFVYFKFLVSLMSMSGSIIAYQYNKIAISIITPILTFLLPFGVEIVTLMKALIPFFGMHFGHETLVEIEGDWYEIDWKNRTAMLLIKGETHNIVRSSIKCRGIEIEIRGFKSYWLSSYKLDSIVIQRVNLPDFKGSCDIIIDIDINGKELTNLITYTNIRGNIKTTENCKRFVSIDGKLLSIRNMELYFCSKFSRRLFINESCIGIQEFACSRCKFLRFVSIPSSASFIGKFAFYGCKMLQRITFRANSKLTMIGESAFSGTNLKSIIFPILLLAIHTHAFHNCPSLWRVEFPEGSNIEYCPSDVFGYSICSFDYRQTMKFIFPKRKAYLFEHIQANYNNDSH